jgi:hypothetical protein
VATAAEAEKGMATMTMGAMGDGYLSGIPGELVVRAQQDTDFALRLLHRESREDAIREAGLDLADEQVSQLHESLDQIANLSFQEALEALRDVGVTRLM